MLDLLICAVVFGVVYALVFLFLQKSNIFKMNFMGMFVVTTILYFLIQWLVIQKFVMKLLA